MPPQRAELLDKVGPSTVVEAYSFLRAVLNTARLRTIRPKN
jgi:hypothetical protein